MALDRTALQALAEQHLATENGGDVDAVMRTVSDDGAHYHVVPLGVSLRTRSEIEAFYRDFMGALPDLRLEVDDVMVDEERRRVAVEHRLTATHRGWLWGLAPTHRRLGMRVIVIYEFAPDGALTREVSYFDKTEMLESLGLVFSTRTTLGRLLLCVARNPLYAARCAWGTLRRSNGARTE
ncbi:ester cyclase [Nannocystis radixulma]|uniref:Ester cyclase n=1 Tax=Nannocystis radixulma TaxID=2995305 RepID=A0ABT5BH51_9BACT|nr:ester cyclase [Nannocystis radixulma]MDC0672367.1 ester cyclase [Nannocystis radixulma]